MMRKTPMRTTTIAVLSVTFAGLMGCANTSQTASDGPDASQTDLSRITTKPIGPALPADHPPIDPDDLTSYRKVRRLSIEQLRNSFAVAVGKDKSGADLTWQFEGTAGLTAFSRALGEADYYNVTEDDLLPSPLYGKFVDDAARDLCGQVITVDASKSDPNTRTLMRYVSLTDTPDKNVAGFNRSFRYLKLRFHGVKISSDADPAIAALTNLFKKAADGQTLEEGWRAVCVALLTAPEFHLY